MFVSFSEKAFRPRIGDREPVNLDLYFYGRLNYGARLLTLILRFDLRFQKLPYLKLYGWGESTRRKYFIGLIFSLLGLICSELGFGDSGRLDGLTKSSTWLMENVIRLLYSVSTFCNETSHSASIGHSSQKRWQN